MKASLRKPKKQITVQFLTVIPMETMLCTRLLEGCSSCELPAVSYCTEGKGLTVRTRSVQMFMKKVSIQNCYVLKEYFLAIRKSVKIIEHERGNLMLIWCALRNNARVWKNHVLMDAT